MFPMVVNSCWLALLNGEAKYMQGMIQDEEDHGISELTRTSRLDFWMFGW